MAKTLTAAIAVREPSEMTVAQSTGKPKTWKHYAACAGMESAIFFHEDPGRSTYKEAREICNSCQVQKECLAYAMTNHEKFGMWGGKTPQERRRIRMAVISS